MSGRQLITLAKVAQLRQDRAERAWRDATRERQARSEEHDAADALRRRAVERRAVALTGFAQDPADQQARIWLEATRQAADERAETVLIAAEALAEAEAQVALDRAEHRRREARCTHAVALVARHGRQTRRAAEERADDEANDARPGRSASGQAR